MSHGPPGPPARVASERVRQERTWRPRQVFLARRIRLGERPLLFEMPAEEAWDICEALDLQIVETLLTARRGAHRGDQP